MAKIDIDPIEKGIKIATSSMQKKGIDSKIVLTKIPDDDQVRAGESGKFAIFEGAIEFEGTNTSFRFFVPIPLASKRKKENWSWIIASGFLGQAYVEFIKDMGVNKKVKRLEKVKTKIVDELIS